jgi:hypothetical protein
MANGQTFTVEHTGMLTGARVHVAKWGTPGDLTVQIANVDTTSGLPTVPEDVIASTTIPASSLPDTGNTGVYPTVDVVFDAPPSVVAGKQYALLLKATGGALSVPQCTSKKAAHCTGVVTVTRGMRIFQRNPFASTPSQWESDQATLGVTFDTVFGIYVTDTIAPKVDAVNPVEGAEGVVRTTNVTATFSGRMDPDTLNTTTFKLFKVNKNGATSRITDAPVRLSQDGLTARLNPFGSLDTRLAKNTKYKAVVTTGAKDLAGNSLDQDDTTMGNQQKVWYFTT